MHKSVLNLINFVWVSVVSESTEATSIQINNKGLIWSHQNIDAHVKLLPSYKKRIHDVFLNDIRFCLGSTRLKSKIVLPFWNLLKLVEKKDSYTLRFSNRFHNPNATLLFKFFNEQRIVSRKVVGCRVKVIPKKSKFRVLTQPHPQIFLPFRVTFCAF